MDQDQKKDQVIDQDLMVDLLDLNQEKDQDHLDGHMDQDQDLTEDLMVLMVDQDQETSQDLEANLKEEIHLMKEYFREGQEHQDLIIGHYQ